MRGSGVRPLPASPRRAVWWKTRYGLQPTTPVSKLADYQMGLDRCGNVFEWLTVRLEQATVEELAAEQAVRTSSFTPSLVTVARSPQSCRSSVRGDRLVEAASGLAARDHAGLPRCSVRLNPASPRSA